MVQPLSSRHLGSSLPELTVIIPTLNEAAHLPTLLEELQCQQGIQVEIIVGDGGSRDATAATARRSGVKVVQAPRGRGIQMNRAAAQARGTFLLFLHADSHLPDPSFLARALAAFKPAREAASGGAVAGHFALRFRRTRRDHRAAYRFLEAKTRLNRCNTTNGDQGFLLTREFFFYLGGFSEELPWLEDQELAEKIRSRGRWITLPGTLATSARRFETQGFHSTYLLMSIIMGTYSTGLRQLFSRLPDVYAAAPKGGQTHGKLLLGPCFQAIRSIQREDLKGWAKARAWWRIGRYIRQNIWQIFYYLDVRTQPAAPWNQHPWLNFHDRRLAPVLANPLMDAMTGAACFMVIFGLLMPCYALAERKS